MLINKNNMLTAHRSFDADSVVSPRKIAIGTLLGLCALLMQQDPVLAASDSYWLDPGPPGTPSGPPLPPPSASGVTTFSFNNRGPGMEVGTTAGNAFDIAVGYVAAWLQDPVDVVLELEFTNLPGNSLAEADNVYHNESFNSARAAMILDQRAHLGHQNDITEDLPAFSQLNVQLPTMAGTWFLGGSMEMTRANAKALDLLGPSTTTDSVIRFDSGTTFDYNPFDGIDAGAYDFIGIAVHELGHVLGFDSEVDKADEFWGTGAALSLSPMDMFRLAPGQGVIDFKNATRILTTGDDPGFETQVSYQGLGIEAELSVAGASSHQASHWKDALGLGIMDPTFALGEAGVPTFTDWRVFDLIGWDAVQPTVLATPVPAAVWLFGSGLALLGFTGKRRSRS